VYVYSLRMEKKLSFISFNLLCIFLLRADLQTVRKRMHDERKIGKYSISCMHFVNRFLLWYRFKRFLENINIHAFIPSSTSSSSSPLRCCFWSALANEKKKKSIQHLQMSVNYPLRMLKICINISQHNTFRDLMKRITEPLELK
jgi:hypothetical protein